MKILSNIPNVYKAMKSNNVQKKENNNATSSSKPNIKVTISKTPDQSEVRKAEVSFVKQKLANTPDIREERVQKLKDQIESGSYQVDLNKVAEAILDRLI